MINKEVGIFVLFAALTTAWLWIVGGGSPDPALILVLAIIEYLVVYRLPFSIRAARPSPRVEVQGIFGVVTGRRQP